MLKSLKVTNLLSFGPSSEPLHLGRLTVMIGPNGSGKSNLIEAIALLQAAPKDLVEPVREGGGIHEWLWKGARGAAVPTVEVVISDEMDLRYRLSLAAQGQRMVVADEVIEEGQISYLDYVPKPRLHDSQGRVVIALNHDPQHSVLSEIKDPERFPRLDFIEQTFSAIRIYRDWTFGRGTPPRRPQPADLPNRYLEEDGRNLGLILNRIRKDVAAKQALIEHLREVYEGVQDVDVSVEGGTVQVFLQEGGWVVPASRLSDGTLRWLCLLAVLLNPAQTGLCCIEEPELGLHPDLIPRLARLLQAAAERMQLIVTTHSDVLVDALNDMPEAIVVCEKHEGATVLRRLSREDLAVWLEQYTLGQLWRSGEIGGNRW